MRYIVDVVKEKTSSSQYDAGSKAPADVVRTLREIGAGVKLIVVPTCKLGFISNFIGVVNSFLVALSLHKNDEVYIQRYGYYVGLFAKIAKCRGVKLNYIVHDLTFLRFGKQGSEGGLEKSLLHRCDVIYAHTESMAETLRKEGFSCPLKVMHLFDYYSDDPMIPMGKMLPFKSIVAFAGNLKKSEFLQKMVDMNIPDSIQYNLYGLPCEIDFARNPQIKYKSAFAPSRTGTIEAGWGLLWDGDSVDDCTGVLGNYLRINSSHKLSLYLVCGMPVILWRQSSLAEWLSSKGVCILIDRLQDISTALSKITDDEYMKMVTNARELGFKLRNGELLKTLIQQ